mgnify:FL=1
MTPEQSLLPGLKTPLWKHQPRMLNFALEKRNVMFAAWMGSGKSLATLAVITARQHKRILIVCPLPVVGSWENQLVEHADFPYVFARLDKGAIANRLSHARLALHNAAILGCPYLAAINYESVWREPFASWVLQAGLDLIVCDESHRMKKNGGRMGMYGMRLGRIAPYRLALTGTPFAHSPMSIFSQFRFVEPSVFGTRYVPFRDRYAIMGGYQGRQIIGYQNMEDLKEKFHSRAIVISREESLPDLPPQTFMERTTTFSPKIERLYRSLHREFYAQVANGEVTAGNALVKLLRLQQLTSGHVTLDDGTSKWVSDHKKDLLRDTLEDLDEPVVVFARFTRDLDIVREVTEYLGRTYGEVSGRRKDLTDAAKMPLEVNILGVNIQAGGVGIDLNRAATSIWYSTGFSLADYEQALARLHRPGQTRHVTHIHLITENSVDRTVRRALAARKEVVQAIMEHRYVNGDKRLENESP